MVQGAGTHEGLGFGFETVREVPHYPPQGDRARDLYQPAPQAAAGLVPNTGKGVGHWRELIGYIVRKTHGTNFGSRPAA